MHARVATFEGDPSRVDDAIEMVRTQVESDETPAGLEGAKMLMLINRETGKGLGVTLFESEDAMRRGDEALNAMNPGGTSGGRRSSSTRSLCRPFAKGGGRMPIALDSGQRSPRLSSCSRVYTRETVRTRRPLPLSSTT